MLSYYIIVRPFENNLSNFLAIYNEACFCFTYFIILLHSYSIFTEDFGKIIGWVLISLIGISLSFTWIFMLPPMLKSVYLYLKKLCTRNTRYSIDGSSGSTKALPKIEKEKRKTLQIKDNDDIELDKSRTRKDTY